MTTSVSQAQRARAQRPQPVERRELTVQAIVGAVFLIAAGVLVAFGFDGDVNVVDLVILVVVAAVLERMDFEIGGGFASPTQLALVPMLFVLPPAIVPVAVAAALVLAWVPAVLGGRWHPQRLIGVLGDALFAIGPAVVFTVAQIGAPSLGDWPIYLLALAAQFACDLASSVVRMGVGRGVAMRAHLRVLSLVWLFDLLLSPIGLLAADASERHARAYLLTLPLSLMLAAFARERRERIGHAIELMASYRGTALLLGDVLSDEDEYTGMHTAGVVGFAVQIADELGMDEDERRLVDFGALLHDIGKIATPKEILHKSGPLTDAEWVVMRKHTIEGQRMLDRVGGMLHDVGLIVRASHESYDGSGYPDGLAGAEIPLAARIVAVADAHSAMTTNRPYRAAMEAAAAAAELRASAGRQFDPVVVDAALVVLARHVPGANGGVDMH